MSLSKRKRPGTEPPPLSSDDQRILDLIKSKQGSGMARTEIKFQTKIAETIVTKSIKSLLAKSLIQEVKPKNSSRKVYMGVEFTPSNEVSGGFWYLEGKLDTEFIKQLKGFCTKHLKVHKVATLEGIHKILLEGEVVKGQIPIEHIAELLNTMVLDDQILEVKSTGLGDYYRLPVGKMCYRLPAAGGGVAAECTTADIALPLDKLCLEDGLSSSDSKGNIFVVLVSTGSFNPPTYMHLRCFELARDAVNSQGFCVIGGYMSPVNDSYKKKGLISARHRIAMCNLACKSSDFVMVDTWEASQSTYQRTLTILSRVRTSLCESGLMSSESLKVLLVCGSDLLESFSIPGFWIREQ